jgi:hypothetical protein
MPSRSPSRQQFLAHVHAIVRTMIADASRAGGAADHERLADLRRLRSRIEERLERERRRAA